MFVKLFYYHGEWVQDSRLSDVFKFHLRHTFYTLCSVFILKLRFSVFSRISSRLPCIIFHTKKIALHIDYFGTAEKRFSS